MPSTIPERTCVGCRTKRTQAELVRVVLASDGTAIASRTAPGRGAWLCAAQAWRCLELAEKRRGLERAFRTPLDDGALVGLMSAVRAKKMMVGDAVPRDASGEVPAQNAAIGWRDNTAGTAGERS